jgi:Insertion element 4 transposase N-terminal/Transposase DDE domain
MSFKIAQLPADDKMAQLVSVELLTRLYPRELVCQLLTELRRWEQRESKLSHVLMVYYVIVLSLFPRLGLREVYAHLLRGWHWLGGVLVGSLPSAGALCYRRGTLGIGVLRCLLRQVCRPLATPQTPGAYRFGLRLMAIDSTLEDVADTPANAAFFGRVASGASASPFPQARCLYLAEVGTHAIVDARIAPCRISDHHLLPALLRSVEADMLVLLDRGVFSGPTFAALRAKQAHGLARLEAGMLTKPLRRLSDGSYLVELTPKTSRGLSHPLLLRVIEYRLNPPVAQQMKQLAQSTTSRACDPTQVHRLVTTLLDPQLYPALDLIVCYHERWEIELCIDEVKIHLRLSAHPLRSRTPLGVLQELYGLLLLHYALRTLMATSAAQADLDPDRLSFTHAIHVLSDALLLAPLVPIAAQSRFWQQVLADLRDPHTLLPPRRLRFNPRVLKHSSHFRHKRSTDQGFHLKHRSFADILLI